jgi:hypothetical protein
VAKGYAGSYRRILAHIGTLSEEFSGRFDGKQSPVQLF